MSVLPDNKIIELLAKKEFTIEPFVLQNVQPSSIDLTLDSYIKIPAADGEINPLHDSSEYFIEHTIGESYSLEPHSWILARIGEKISLPNFCNGHIFNRNSIARLGVDVSCGAYINPGYSGQLPLVIHNHSNFKIQLIPHMRICQLELNMTDGIPQRSYGTRGDEKYFGETDSLVSALHKDAEFEEFLKLHKKEHELSSFLKDRIHKNSQEILESLSESEKERLGL